VDALRDLRRSEWITDGPTGQDHAHASIG
jgi:hypothetical protein